MFVWLLFIFPFLGQINALCPSGSLRYQTYCYFFNSTHTEFAAAEINCNGLNGHLASIHDAFTNVVLGQEAPFHESSENDFWLGTTTLLGHGNWTWTDGTSFDFNDWKDNEPKNITGLNCAALSLTDGYWSAQDCFKQKPYVCAVDESIFDSTTAVTSTTTMLPVSTTADPTNCNSSNWFHFGFNSHYYFYVKDAKSFDKAHAYCRSCNSDLASIHNIDERILLWSFVYWHYEDQYNPGYLTLWTGLYWPANGPNFVWTDGTPFDYSYFGPDGTSFAHESKHCFFLNTGDTETSIAYFYPYNCTVTYPFVCKK